MAFRILVLLLASVLNAAVAISFGSLASAPVDDEVSGPGEMPGFTLKDAPFLEVEALEAAVVAKYVVEKISYGEALKPYQESRPSSILSRVTNIFTRNRDPKPVVAAEPESKPVVAAEDKAPEKNSSNGDATNNATATTSKFTLKSDKKTLNADTPPPEAVTTTAAPRSRKVVMHDTPHYRNHGASMVHVEPTAAKPAKMGAEPAVDAAQTAAKLAEKRAEVEDIFHVSKKDSQTSQDAKKDLRAKGGFSLLRLLPFLLILLSMAGMAYHKFQYIFQMSTGRGLPRFKAKQEDYDDASFLGIVSSLIGGMAGGNPRSGSNAKRSGDFGV